MAASITRGVGTQLAPLHDTFPAWNGIRSPLVARSHSGCVRPIPLHSLPAPADIGSGRAVPEYRRELPSIHEDRHTTNRVAPTWVAINRRPGYPHHHHHHPCDSVD